MIRRCKVLPALVLALTLLCVEASAHAVLFASSPEDGAVVERAPTEIVLRFNEPVAPVTVRLFGSSGEIAASEAPRSAGPEVRLRLPADLREGGYLVSWRVVSPDSHPVAGSLAFAVGTAATPPGAELGSGAESGWRLAKILLRLIGNAALMVAAGGVLFCLLVLTTQPVPSRILHLAKCAALVAIVCACALIGVQGGLMRSEPVAILFDVETWRIGWTTHLGASAAAAASGLILAILGQASRTRWAMAVGSIVATSSLSFAGHSATSGWIIQVALAVHATCAAYWLGSLWPLHAVLRHTPSTRAAIVIRRFSAIAVPTVVALAICGVVITASRIDDVELALSSEYGQILLAKLILVTALLGVAAVNRLAVTPKLIQGSNIAADTLRRNIGIEIALGMAILAMTTFLVHSPPPTAAMHASHAGHRDDHEVDPRKSVAVESRGRVAVISVAPGRAGGNAITVELRGPDAGPLQLEDVQIALSHSDAGIEPLERTATPAGEGRYTLARVDLPLTGRWTVRVDALISDFEKASFEAEITID